MYVNFLFIHATNRITLQFSFGVGEHWSSVYCINKGFVLHSQSSIWCITKINNGNTTRHFFQKHISTISGILIFFCLHIQLRAVQNSLGVNIHSVVGSTELPIIFTYYVVLVLFFVKCYKFEVSSLAHQSSVSYLLILLHWLLREYIECVLYNIMIISIVFWSTGYECKQLNISLEEIKAKTLI